MATDGFTAFDCGISQPVLVMTTVLMFLADSPMHAEITNTPVPGISLNPCRICCLSAPNKKAKKSLNYLQRFLQLDPHGFEVIISQETIIGNYHEVIFIINYISDF